MGLSDWEWLANVANERLLLYLRVCACALAVPLLPIAVCACAGAVCVCVCVCASVPVLRLSLRNLSQIIITFSRRPCSVRVVPLVS